MARIYARHDMHFSAVLKVPQIERGKALGCVRPQCRRDMQARQDEIGAPCLLCRHAAARTRTVAAA